MSAWTWESAECTECGAGIGEDCFVTDRVWGKLPYAEPSGNTHHQARIMAVIQHPDNPGRRLAMTR